MDPDMGGGGMDMDMDMAMGMTFQPFRTYKVKGERVAPAAAWGSN
jgi:hypothetical protein